ncbi:MAG: MMPL family transporter [Acholeplasmataceae bacterium]|nr:MMPL family transporter [Acholeplasmataceae bacterium]
MKKRVYILIIVGLITLMSALLIPKVETNYDLTTYLPEDSITIVGLETLEDEFGIHSFIEMQVNSISVNQVILLKSEIAAIDHVETVLWLDDYVDLTLVPIEFIDDATLSSFYVNQSALLQISIGLDNYDLLVEDVINEIRIAASDYEFAMRGETLNNIENRVIANNEVLKIMLLIIPIVIIILLIASKSWIEPVILLISLGIAVVLNLGSNILLPNVSFITKTMALALQLALSLDYGLFLVHRYYEEKETTDDVLIAIKNAFKRSFPAITASALTTIAGFLSILFMQYAIGFDIGIVLSKGIFLSYVTTLLVTPILIYFMHKLIDKTMHKAIIRSSKKYIPFISKLKYPLFILFIIFTIGSLVLSNKTDYIYGNNSVFDPDRQITLDADMIAETFGSYQQIVILVPNSDVAKEVALAQALSDNVNVTKVSSIVTVVDPITPRELIPIEIKTQFIGENYTRFIVYTSVIEENELLYEFQDELVNMIDLQYDDYYIVGVHQATAEIKDLVITDKAWITFASMIAIFIILFITFKSFVIPLVLVLVIQSAIWMNLSILFLQGISTIYLGYLVVMTIQLGATIDYAVLLTNRYVNYRKEFSPIDSMDKSYQKSFITIMISAIVLAAAGFIEGGFSNLSSIQEIGFLLGKGTTISFIYVLLFLPALLIILDKFLYFKSKKNK